MSKTLSDQKLEINKILDFNPLKVTNFHYIVNWKSLLGYFQE